MNRSTLILLAGLSIIGCSSGPAIVVTKTAFVLPPGATQAQSDDKSVTVGLPGGWRVGVSGGMSSHDMMSGMVGDAGSGASGDNSASGELGKALGDMAKQNEAEMKKEEQEALEKYKAEGIILHCVNSSKPIPGEKPTAFYIKKQSQGGNWSWEDAEKSEVGQYKTKPKAAKIALPIGQAIRMQDTWQLVDGANYTEISYVIPNGKDLYTLRFITEESAEVLTGIDKQVAESFRIN